MARRTTITGFRYRKTDADIKAQVARIRKEAWDRQLGHLEDVDRLSRRFRAAARIGRRMLLENDEYVRELEKESRELPYPMSRLPRLEIDRIRNRRTLTRDDIRRVFGDSRQRTQTENARQIQSGQRSQGGGGGGAQGNSTP